MENLFDRNATPAAASTYIKNDGTTASSGEYSLYQVNIEPNTAYTIINSGSSTAPGYAIYNSSGEKLSAYNYANRAAVTFTTPVDAAYIKFSVVTLSTSGRYDKDTFYLGKVVNNSSTIDITEDHDIYALWTPNKYTITLNNQSATSAGQISIYEKYNSGYYLDSNTVNKITTSAHHITLPTKTGYTFGGYYTETNGNGTQYINANGYITSSASASNFTANGTLYAKWTANKYYLTYDYQDRYTYSGSNALDTGYKYNWDKNFKIESKFKVTATGKRYAVFSSYNDTTKNLALEITTDNKLRVFMGNSSIDDKSSTVIPVNTDITTTFQWNASTKTYTLTATGTGVNISMTNTLSSMNGSGTKNVLVGRDERTTTFSSINVTMFKISTEYDYNTTISTLPTVSKTGYTYSGWYDAASGGNKVTSVTIPAANKTIYAQKAANQYTLTINPNGGTKNGSTAARTLGTKLIYDSTNWNHIGKDSDGGNATRTGYTLTGYYTAATGGTKVYNADGTCVKGTAYWSNTGNGTYIGTSNLTVYAQWTPVTYSIKFNANGGSGTMSNETMTYGTAKNLTANAFTRTDYVFLGWATSSTGNMVYTNKQSVNNLTTTNGKTVNLYAVWIGIGDTVNYNANRSNAAGGTFSTPYSYTTNISDSTKNDYTGERTTAATFKSNDTMTWKVLGADETTGQIQLLAVDGTPNPVQLAGRAGYAYSENVLNNVSAVYGHGYGAASARSVMVEDINKLTGFTPAGKTTESYTSGDYFVELVKNAYGVVTSYNVKAASTNSPVSVTEDPYYYYSVSDYITNTSSNKYKMLFPNSIGYYFASHVVLSDTVTGNGGIAYGVRGMSDGYVGGFIPLCGSASSDDGGAQLVVSPVVTLNSNIQLTWDSTNSRWNITSSGTTNSSTSSSLSLLSTGRSLSINSLKSLVLNITNEIDENESDSSNTISVNDVTNENADNQVKVTQVEEKEDDETIESLAETSTGTVAVEPQETVKIAGTTYSTITEALASANSGDTIKILKDIELTDEINIEVDKNIVLNLNGKTITSTFVNTINNKGTISITGTGIIKNEAENGVVIYNTGTLNIENGVITTEKNGGKAIYNSGSTAVINMKAGKVVTEGIGAIGIYNVENSKASIEGGIIESRGYGSKNLYNSSELEINNAKVIVSEDDAIGIYNAKDSKSCVIKNTEITVEAEQIENYELIKNTKEFLEELEEKKPSYGIYNDSNCEVVFESGTIKVERLKGVGIMNKIDGSITLGKDDDEVSISTPIIYAISDNTTAIVNSDSEKGEIKFYDGKTLTIQSIKNIFTALLKKHHVFEEVAGNNIASYLVEDESNSGDGSNSSIDNKENVEEEEVKQNSVEEEQKSEEKIEQTDADIVEESSDEESSVDK